MVNFIECHVLWFWVLHKRKKAHNRISIVEIRKEKCERTVWNGLVTYIVDQYREGEPFFWQLTKEKSKGKENIVRDT